MATEFGTAIVTPDASSFKIKYDCGIDIDSNTIYRTSTYGNVKPNTATYNNNNELTGVAYAIAELQSDDMQRVNRIDNSVVSL